MKTLCRFCKIGAEYLASGGNCTLLGSGFVVKNRGQKMEAVGVHTRLEAGKGATLPSLGQLSSYHQKISAGSGRLMIRGLWASNFTRRQVAPVQYKFAPLSSQRSITIRAFSKDKDDWSSDDDGQWDPSFEIEVPSDQRPVCSFSSLLVVKLKFC